MYDGMFDPISGGDWRDAKIEHLVDQIDAKDAEIARLRARVEDQIGRIAALELMLREIIDADEKAVGNLAAMGIELNQENSPGLQLARKAKRCLESGSSELDRRDARMKALGAAEEMRLIAEHAEHNHADYEMRDGEPFYYNCKPCWALNRAAQLRAAAGEGA